MHYPRISFWHSALESIPERGSLSGDIDVDVAIVGAGFTGLWTAYELLCRSPALRVAIIEAHTVGFGASGRNGGWVEGTIAGHRETWAKDHGRDSVVRLEKTLQQSLHVILGVVQREQIACAFHQGGTLAIAQNDWEMSKLRERIAYDRQWGIDETDSYLLTAAETTKQIAISDVVGARYSPHCAQVQPAALAHGLAQAVERRGGLIYEGTAVTEIVSGTAYTNYGAVTAPVVVRATEAYTGSLAGQRRLVLPMFSAMIATEPISAGVWAELGWDGRETLSDSRSHFIYAQRTADNRVAIGGRGVPYQFGSRTALQGRDGIAQSSELLRQRLVELFPPLRGVRVESCWYGVFGVTRDWMPSVGFHRATGLAWAGGYVGEGVAAANVAGRTLADLILERETDLTNLPWVNHTGRKWPVEPFRYIGVRGTNALMKIGDRQERQTNKASIAGKIARLISGLR